MSPPPLMSLLLAAAVLFVCSAAAAPKVMELTQEELQKLFEENFKRFKAFKCRTPQKRSVMVSQLLVDRGRLLPSQLVSPSATVLHVCGPTTGCCFSADQVCAPADTKNVTLRFQVLDAVRRAPIAELPLSFVNHTRCSCVPRGSTSANPETVVLL